MNHDAPMTPAAMQAHIAELEQQLKLSDEGVSQLAQRCLWAGAAAAGLPDRACQAQRRG